MSKRKQLCFEPVDWRSADIRKNRKLWYATVKQLSTEEYEWALFEYKGKAGGMAYGYSHGKTTSFESACGEAQKCFDDVQESLW